MQLPLKPAILPMLAKRVEELPEGDDWVYEPKWDGFRTVVFRDRGNVVLQSREGKPLNRFFPEVADAVLEQVPEPCVLDGEIVIARRRGGLDFDALQIRLHPAASRVKLLAQRTPASIVFFDLLARGGKNLTDAPFAERRRQMEALLKNARAPVHLTPATRDPRTAHDWFRRFEGAGLDGVIAKDGTLAYMPDQRVMFKLKHQRDCDCVVAGFRWYRKGDQPAVGSLMLGLYDADGGLRHVGVCGSFPMAKRLSLVPFLQPYRKNAGRDHPWTEGTIGQSRWSQGKDLSWEPLRPELVAEVAYEQMQNGRFRHMAQFRRWRPDKPPHQCTYDQLETVPPLELRNIFAA
jgi:ATP-dependent DNA ligase